MKANETRAIAKSIRITPRKIRLVVDLVRGKTVKEALGILANINKSGVLEVTKVIRSAASNAVNNHEMTEGKLYIHTIYANDGTRLKRFMPRARGSASGLVKRTSSVTVVLKEKEGA